MTRLCASLEILDWTRSAMPLSSQEQIFRYVPVDAMFEHFCTHLPLVQYKLYAYILAVCKDAESHLQSGTLRHRQWP